MNFNVPGSIRAEDEFCFPGGNWCSAYRSITFDSALTWADALPRSPVLRGMLEACHIRNIATLARHFYRAELAITRKRPPLESPFEVIRWWDPTDRDWQHGRRCCLRLQGLSLPEFLGALPSDRVRSIARSGDTLEAIIPNPSDRRRRLHS